jgi:hypothetical protein
MVGGDDAADCLRYLVPTKARAVTQRKLRGLWRLSSIASPRPAHGVSLKGSCQS